MIYAGRDHLRMTGFKLFFGLIRNPSAKPGEHRHRLNVSIHVSGRFGFSVALYTYPAWRDEPSVVDEWNRTMRPCTRFTEMSVNDLRMLAIHLKWSLNTRYGRISSPQPVDTAGIYDELRTIRHELRIRGHV